MEQPKSPSTDEWIKMMRYIYRMEYRSATVREGARPCAKTQMGLEDIILSKINQKEKDKYWMISLICRT